jgi:N6-adenosine-specific RNA methylase IME4
MRATRRLDQMRQAQSTTIGLADGAAARARVGAQPELLRPTLASQGIDKNLAQQGRVLGALSDERFEEVIADARDKVTRAVRNAVREVEIKQEREVYRARTKQGGTVTDLKTLIATGTRFGVICPDFPWEFEAYSGKGKQRSAERHYDVWPLERILAMAPILKALAAPDCALLLWAVWPELAGALELIRRTEFAYESAAFVWVKATKNAEIITPDGTGLHWGMGYATRSNTEVCLLATRGNPLRLAADVHQVVFAPVGKHSEKPSEVYHRAERLYPGPYLEMFARRPRAGWTTWGDEVGKFDWGASCDA